MSDLIKKISLLDHGYVQLVGSWGDDLEPLRSARMSTNNETGINEKKDDNLREYLWRHQHTSPFEFAELILEIQTPLFVAREWMRHRTFSYNEFSQRYSEALDIYYVPVLERMELQSNINNQGSEGKMDEETAMFIIAEMQREHIEHRETYNKYIDEGLARELARLNMPVSNYTKFRVKGNLKNWFHFINLRIRSGAQYEIRVYAEAILTIVRELWPKMAGVFEEYTLYAISLGKTEKEIMLEFLDGCMEVARMDSQITSQEFMDILTKDKLTGMRKREFMLKLGLVQ
jgi:thymidylate synthase (FAD)